MRCVLLAKKWPRFGSNFKKMAKKISNGESDGERKIYPSANPGEASIELGNQCVYK